MSLEEFKTVPHTINGVIDKWAEERPDKVALFFMTLKRNTLLKNFVTQ